MAPPAIFNNSKRIRKRFKHNWKQLEAENKNVHDVISFEMKIQRQILQQWNKRFKNATAIYILLTVTRGRRKGPFKAE